MTEKRTAAHFLIHSTQTVPHHLGGEPRRSRGEMALTWPEGSVERCEDSELREEEEQGEDGSDFT